MEVFYKEPDSPWIKDVPVTDEVTRELVMKVGKKHVNEQDGYRLTFYYFMTNWYLTDVEEIK